LTGAQALDRAVFVLETAARTTTADAAQSAVATALDDLNAEDLRRVVACLAENAVRAAPPIHVARWIERLTLEHLLLLDYADGDS
jgi:hypothetical protein